MQERTNLEMSECRCATFWRSASALALGVLLGALATMPYGRLFGLPDVACGILRSLVATVALAGLGTGRADDLVFTLPATGPVRKRCNRV